jgi:hypothetical protein
MQVRRHHVGGSIVLHLLLLETGMHLLGHVVQGRTIVCVGKRAVVNRRLRSVTTAHPHTAAVHGKIDKCGVSLVEVVTSVLLVLTLHLLALQFALYAFTVRSISDKRQDWSDAFDEEHALRGFRIVESSLGTASLFCLMRRGAQEHLPAHNNCQRSRGAASRDDCD